MFSRVVAAAACVLSVAGCQQAGSGLTSTAGVTGPTPVSIKAVYVPFSGAAPGEAAFDFLTNPKACPSGFTTITTGKGTASHMGLTTWQSQHCADESHVLTNADLVLTAADGDEIHATYTGSCQPLPESVGEPFTCSGQAVFEGGTGRFADATGTAEWTATVTFQGFADFSWPGLWKWQGSIRY